MKPQAEAVQNWNSGIPSNRPASMPKLITPSETMHLTGGTSEEFNLAISSNNGAKQLFLVESNNAGMS